MPRNVTKVSISLPNGLLDLLNRKAKQEDRPRSTVIKRLIVDGIAYQAEHRLIDAGVEYQTGGDDARDLHDTQDDVINGGTP